MDNWYRQFYNSLKKYEGMIRAGEQEVIDLLDFPNSNFTDSTESHIKDIVSSLDNAESSELFLVALTNQYIRSVFVDLKNLLNLVESPIERQMGVALWISGKMHFSKVSMELTSKTDIKPSSDELIIKPQGSIGEYRADFILKTSAILPKFEDGQIIRDVRSSKYLVVECDGHAFHEKTKAQAKKDKTRDRFMQSEGFEVFRYTGSEIWNDVFACAEQAVCRVRDSSYDKASELSDA